MNVHEKLVKKLKLMNDELVMLRLRVAQLESKLLVAENFEVYSNQAKPCTLDSIDDDSPTQNAVDTPPKCE